MKSWQRPTVPSLPGRGEIPRIWDTATNQLARAEPTGETAGIYVCGITPYDATHIGHAATYLAYDTLIRLWLDAGFEVRYVQNVTDVDDPLLERAAATGVDWRDLAATQIELFRGDMEALGIIPPNHYVAVTERVGQVADAVQVLLARGMAYRLDIDAGAAVAPGLGGEARGGVTQIQVDSYPDVYRDANPDSYPDIYFDNSAAEAGSPWRLGDESHFDRATMLRLSAERGGDPDRPGKRDALDPLLWRAARPGEPSWDSPVGAGRPGWHIECSLIAQDYLEVPVTVNGGGSDLIFPHHEFSGGHTAALTGKPLAALYSHAGLVAYLGEKMSKSLGNLVFVSKLTEAGVDPRAIRLAILAQSYRANWEWTDAVLATASERLDRWVAWATRTQATTHANGNTDAKTSTGAKTNTDAKTISDAKTRTDAKSNTDADLVGAVVGDVVGVSPLLARLRLVLANDLDSPAALAEVDSQISAGANPIAGDLEAIDALLGIRLLR